MEQFLELVDDDDVGVASTGSASRSRAIDVAPEPRTTTVSPRARSAGTIPASTSEDFPHPDAPETARNGDPASRASAAWMSASRPKNSSASSVPNGCRPRYGQSALVSWGSGGRVERGILVQDRGLERNELRAGLDAELVGQPLPRATQGGEGIGLTAAPVERRGEDRPPPFAKRVGPDQALRIGDDGAVLTALEPRGLQVLLGRTS